MKECNKPVGGTVNPAVGGEGPGHTPSPPGSAPSESTQPWTLDLDNRREAALLFLVYLVWDSKFLKWSTRREFDDLQGSS